MIKYFLARERGDTNGMARWSYTWLDMMETRMAIINKRMLFSAERFSLTFPLFLDLNKLFKG